MRRTIALFALGLAWSTGLGACVVSEDLVGVNAGSGGDTSEAGMGDGSVAGGGATSNGGSSGGVAGGGTGAAAGVGAGAGEVSLGKSVNYFVSQIRGDAPADVCLPRALPAEPSGATTCRVYAVPLGISHCDVPSRPAAAAAAASTVLDYVSSEGQCRKDEGVTGEVPRCSDLVVCDVAQAEGTDLAACQNELEPPPDTNGWCYVAPEDGIGSAELVELCSQLDRRRVRFFGDAEPRPDEIFVLACTGSSLPPGAPVALGAPPAVRAAVGAPCITSDEYYEDFAGYAIREVTVETDTAACDSGVCLVNHFQGRVSCPYGQTQQDLLELDPERACYVPGSDVRVSVPVSAQIVARQAEATAICSCRCDGPGPGPFCACPSDMECVPLISQLGLSTDDALAGSYCVATGTAFDVEHASPPTECGEAGAESCGDPRPY